MNAVIGVITVCLGLLFVWFMIKLLIGVFTPPEVSGRLYLKQQLAKAGVDPRYIPDGCLDEFVAETKDIAELKEMIGKEHFKTEFVHRLDAVVRVILKWRDNPNDSFFWDSEKEMIRYREILEKYHIK